VTFRSAQLPLAGRQQRPRETRKQRHSREVGDCGHSSGEDAEAAAERAATSRTDAIAPSGRGHHELLGKAVDLAADTHHHISGVVGSLQRGCQSALAAGVVQVNLVAPRIHLDRRAGLEVRGLPLVSAARLLDFQGSSRGADVRVLSSEAENMWDAKAADIVSLLRWYGTSRRLAET